MNWLRRSKDNKEYNLERSEDEDMDLAIALSLAEQKNRGKAVIDEDESLAWALQDCLAIESEPPRQTSVKCAGCKAKIDRGNIENFMGATWHSNCIRCHACSRSISRPEAFMHKNHLYHKSCYDQLCEVCLKSLSPNSYGRKAYLFHPIWNQKACLSHCRDGTPRCCSCYRLEPNGIDFVKLNDRRELCLECLGSATMESIECQPLYMDVREFFENLSMKVEQQIPLLLVGRDGLNEAMEKDKNHNHDALTIGMTMFETQVIRTVVESPVIGPGGRIIGIKTDTCEPESNLHITAILVLYGLPRLFTGSVLAHEMMHAWLRLSGYPRLQPEIEEGLCQVMAYKWIQSEMMACSGDSSSSSSSSSSQRRAMTEFERKLCEHIKREIETNPSRAYGDGFRAANAAVNKYGLKRTLEQVKRNGRLR